MLLDGKILSEKIKDEISSSINSNLIKPCLALIQIGDDEAINIYIKVKKKLVMRSAFILNILNLMILLKKEKSLIKLSN